MANVTASHKCGHTKEKNFTSPGSLVARHWKGRVERTPCNACRLAAMEVALQALDADQLRAVVRRCHNVPRLMALLHKAAAK